MKGAELRRARRAREIGDVPRAPSCDLRVVFLYPAPYAVGMSSLGFQTILREMWMHPGVGVDRAFLPDSSERMPTPFLTFDGEAPVGSADVIAVSVAYELELAALVTLLDAAGIPCRARDRGPRHPFVLAGGPLTFSNPLPLGVFADAVLLGEADETIHDALTVLRSTARREQRLEDLQKIPSCWIPSHHGEGLPALGLAAAEKLPASSAIRSPDAELSGMHLVEVERGCSRGCTYCVMRKSTNGGMRVVPKERIRASIPADAHKVGLVGAAVTDHPEIVSIVSELVDLGKQVSLSSLRADRLSEPFVAALMRGGARSLTTAADGASERLRILLKRGGRTEHLMRAAELARRHGAERLKLYVMLGVPTETEDDVDELVALATELSKLLPTSLGVAPFVAKRNTPLAGLPFAGIDVVDARIRRLRGGLRGCADVRPLSSRWAWVEWSLAQGGMAHGEAVVEAVRAGGNFAAWRSALERVPRPATLSLLQGVS